MVYLSDVTGWLADHLLVAVLFVVVAAVAVAVVASAAAARWTNPGESLAVRVTAALAAASLVISSATFAFTVYIEKEKGVSPGATAELLITDSQGKTFEQDLHEADPGVWKLARQKGWTLWLHVTLTNRGRTDSSIQQLRLTRVWGGDPLTTKIKVQDTSPGHSGSLMSPKFPMKLAAQTSVDISVALNACYSTTLEGEDLVPLVLEVTMADRESPRHLDLRVKA